MTVPVSALQSAAGGLHRYLVRNHWTGRALQGPDSGVRINARVGRFVKSYLPFWPWTDSYVYLQAQGYWILDNWLLVDLRADEGARQVALACSDYVLASQRPGGYWEYANPEWRGRIATVEGNFAALGLLESYVRTGDERFLAGARAWHRYLIDEVGFQGGDDELAVNYFANVAGGMVPNNTVLTLRTLARFVEATGDGAYLSRSPAMVAWLARAQVDTGELPYALARMGGPGRPHFLCYQYNAFEFLDLVEYYRLTDDRAIRPVLERLAAFISTGLTGSGAARYNCHHDRPEVPYYTAAVARALSEASSLGLGDFRSASDLAYQRLLSQQRPDGSIEFFSRGNYGWLTDRRSYPRNLAMILYHLLGELRGQPRSLVAADRAEAAG
ncbi:MAG TPA: hypothetical protein VGL23_05075 [Chloroflexota bacterium]